MEKNKVLTGLILTSCCDGLIWIFFRMVYEGLWIDIIYLSRVTEV